MNIKKYLNALLIILAVAGISMIDVSVPNQQVVIQFATSHTTTLQIQDAIAAVEKDLENAGASHIKVEQLGANSLKITYYSSIDIASVKEFLAVEHTSTIAYSSSGEDQYPHSDNSSKYELSIYEIQNGDISNEGLNGVALEVETKVNRYFYPLVYFTANKTKSSENFQHQKGTNVFISYNQFKLQRVDYKIPEVRAGPIS